MTQAGVPAGTGPAANGPAGTGAAAAGPGPAGADPAGAVTTPEAVVARFNLAWSRHDLAAALELISADCVFDSTGPAPDGQRSVGKDAIRAAWQPIFDDSSSQFTVEEFFTAGPRVVQRWRYDWDGGHVRGVDVMTVAGGLVTAKLSYVKG
jgi:ketosteroid isomerase-like protein